MTDSTINIRSIQHYMYCPRRFSLIEINDDWGENSFVVNANIMHKHVHDGSHSFSSQGKIVRSSVAVYNDELDIFGILDCIEFIRNKNGVLIDILNEKCKINVIEYKPKPPKDCDYHDTDAIQLFAQKKCVDSIWNCDSDCYIYYTETKRRVKLPFDNLKSQLSQQLTSYLSEMREVIESGIIPPRKKGQKCVGCSISDLCFSKTAKYRIKDEIELMKGGIE